MSKGVNDKASQVDFINQNNQKIHDVHELENSDDQFSYQIKCLNCGHLYSVNSTNLFQCKCLICQDSGFNCP